MKVISTFLSVVWGGEASPHTHPPASGGRRAQARGTCGVVRSLFADLVFFVTWPLSFRIGALKGQPIGHNQNTSNRARIFASSRCCTAVVDSLILAVLQWKKMNKVLGSALRATTPKFHDGSSSIQVRWRYVPSYLLSAASSSSSTTHTTTSDGSFCRRKVHIPWSNLLFPYACYYDHDYVC